MFKDDVCVRRWLDGLAESTGENRLPLLHGFFEFASVGPSEAVEFQRQDPLDYRFVDTVYKWVENRNLAMSTMETRVGCVRGFFLANRAPLPKDKHRFHSSKEPVIGRTFRNEFIGQEPKISAKEAIERARGITYLLPVPADLMPKLQAQATERNTMRLELKGF